MLSQREFYNLKYVLQPTTISMHSYIYSVLFTLHYLQDTTAHKFHWERQGFRSAYVDCTVQLHKNDFTFTRLSTLHFLVQVQFPLALTRVKK